MHQTFYIDIDEEITSIIERLKKSKTKEIVIVVPKRALLIQSIINLKLLKKEADKLKKEIIIVTQDKLGKMLVEKTGIIVEQKLDELDGEEALVDESFETEKEDEFSTEKKFTAKKNELEDLGSNEYFNAVPKRNRRQVAISNTEKENVEKILNKELVADFDACSQKKLFSKKASQSLDMIRNIDIKQKGQEMETEIEELPKPIKKNKRKNVFEKDSFSVEDEEMNIIPNHKADEFFARSERFRKKEKEIDPYQNVQVGGRVWKIFFWFCLLILLAGGVAGAYLFLPKATVTITPKSEIKALDLEIRGLNDSTEPDYAGLAIPVKIVDIENEVGKTFEATGNKSDSNKKARGTITIYNEFSSSPQPLVATTRFLSENGKLFRLEKSVNVPGTTQVGAEVKPGVIEATIVADEAGASFNIEATKFSIPGFQGSGSDKYNKIYAKSSKAMMGGGDSGTSLKSISATDISTAKEKLSAEIMNGLKEKVRIESGDEYIVLDEAANFGEIIYSASVTEGTIGNDFDLTGKAKASVFIFKKADLEKLVFNKIVSVTGIDENQISKKDTKFEFGKADADFANGTILLRVSVKAKVFPDFDLENIKKDILGKNEDEFKAYMSHLKGIEDIYINYWPPYPSGKIPQYKQRVEIILDKN